MRAGTRGGHAIRARRISIMSITKGMADEVRHTDRALLGKRHIIHLRVNDSGLLYAKDLESVLTRRNSIINPETPQNTWSQAKATTSWMALAGDGFASTMLD